MIFVILILGNISCKDQQAPSAILSQSEAIKIAEKFVRLNGYTSYEPDKSVLVPELFDGLWENEDSILAHRHNTLLPKASFIREDSTSWHIGFISSRTDKAKLSGIQKWRDIQGRAVIVEKTGREAKMLHKDPLFSYFKKLKD